MRPLHKNRIRGIYPVHFLTGQTCGASSGIHAMYKGGSFFHSFWVWCNGLPPSHIGDQCLRDSNAAILLLVVFQHRHQSPSHCETGAVQGMDQFCAARPFSLKAYACTPCLEITEIATGGYLPVKILPRKPHFQVIGLGSGKSEVPGTQGDHPVGEAQSYENFLRIGCQFLEFLMGFFRFGEL